MTVSHMAEAVPAGTRGEYHRISQASSRSTWASISDRSRSSTSALGIRSDCPYLDWSDDPAASNRSFLRLGSVVIHSSDEGFCQVRSLRER